MLLKRVDMLTLLRYNLKIVLKDHLEHYDSKYDKLFGIQALSFVYAQLKFLKPCRSSLSVLHI